MATHNIIGSLGERVAARWYEERGFTILERNYREKWGEIDLIARKYTDLKRETGVKVHFVEVKSVSYETFEDFQHAVTHETHRPEEKVHNKKQKRLKRAIQSWLAKIHYKGEFQIDIVVVHFVPREKYASVMLLENVIFQ